MEDKTLDKLGQVVNERCAILKALDTKRLVANLVDAEVEFEKALQAETNYKNVNYTYLCTFNSDSSEVKSLESDLVFKAQGKNDMERKAWLTLQRKENEQLKCAIDKQRSVAFDLETLHNKVEIARKRLEGLRAVIELKTAQIIFMKP